MAEIKSWSQTAGSNNAASPDGAPEGMLPSGVNDTIRENMAAIRKWYDDAQWIDDGGTPTFVSATQFTLSGDKTPTFHVDRRVKCYGTTMGTLYGYITASSYAAPNTTVTVVLDSGSLTSDMSRVYYAALSKTNNSLPNNMFAAKAGSTTQTFDVANATSGAHAVNRNYGDARYAALAGVNTQTFNVAAATAGDHAVNRATADGRYAALAGISTQVFSVAAATIGDHALNRTTADGRYGQLATTNTWSLAQTFSVQPTAPSYGFAGSTAYLNADVANIGVKPPVNGKLFVTDVNNAYRPVVCGAAEASGEAVTLGQADERYAPIALRRNRIINGNFQVNQRGVSGIVTLAAGAYGHDRWKAGAGGCTYTFSTVENVTTLTISAGSLQQVIEGNNLETGTYTLSWTGTAQGKISAGAYASTGVTGSVTGGTNTTIEFNAGTLSKVQFEAGATATPFVFSDIKTIFTQCEYYFQKYTGRIATLQALSTTRAYGAFSFSRMRAAPAVTFLGGGLALDATGTGQATTVQTTSDATTNNVIIDVTVAAGLAAGNASGYYNATGITLSAEL